MKKYQVIYADPPWKYKDKNPQGCAEKHYQTMSVSDIKNLRVNDIAADDCFLFLWATFPMLPEALEVINAWGFKYKTLGFSWIKTNPKAGTPFFGIGHYTKSNCEVCLLAVKGKPKVVNNSVSSVIIAPRGVHSRKPADARIRIDQLVGGGGL
jgi:site-specific DNA-methyltransferase (adenine-specific)